MQKVVSVVSMVMVAFVGLTACSGPKKSTDEENALNSFTNIQNNLESNVSYEEFSRLLIDAKTTLDSLKQSEQTNSCFLSAVDKCYASYEIAKKAWKQKMEVEDERRKQDMDLAFSFSISFAAACIQNANNCYR
jgi:hypothetical protein